jgi:hypothetical protein
VLNEFMIASVEATVAVAAVEAAAAAPPVDAAVTHAA